MGYEFTIDRWAAVAPGLEQEAEWRQWAEHPFLPAGELSPALTEMPAMQRRRVERLGRMALQVAWRCQPEAGSTSPMVFGSRHGDLARTDAMLQALAQDDTLSPTSFGLSTHNAIAAQYSIARQLLGNCVVVSAGARTAEAVVTEAAALLADGAPEVLAVVYDLPPPLPYQPHLDEPQAAYAWAWRMASAVDGQVRYSLECDLAGAVCDAAILPGGLEVLRFLLAGERELRMPGVTGSWVWRRHD